MIASPALRPMWCAADHAPDKTAGAPELKLRRRCWRAAWKCSWGRHDSDRGRIGGHHRGSQFLADNSSHRAQARRTARQHRRRTTRQEVLERMRNQAPIDRKTIA
jgi:hypothetical protein